VLGTHSLGVFLLTGLVLNLTPGVDMMFTLTQTLRHGIAAGIAGALGIVIGCVVHTLVAAFGLAALLAASATAFTVVKWCGAAYLAWLAIGMLREAAAPAGRASAQDAADAEPGQAPQPAAITPRPTLARIFGQGLLTNVLNPKIAIFFLALLPQFIDADAANKLLAFLFLGGVFVVQGALFLVAFVLLVAPLRRWRASPAWRRGLHASGAGIFLWLAARLALAERP
jgi:threonine/homoserine/homoserine lactone efflux protein